MDEQAQVAEVFRRRRSRAETEQLVAEYEVSGLSRVEFCRRKGLSLATLVRYRKRQQQGQGETATGNRWLAVEVSGSSAARAGGSESGLALMLAGGRRIAVGRGFDAHTLVQLLSLLEGR